MFSRIGRTATIALAFVLVGFLLIFLAWNGAASLDYAQGQIPFLISGGLGGVGLIGLGAGLLLFEAGRRHLARLERKFDELIEVTAGRAPGAVEAAQAAAPTEEALVTAAMNGRVVVGRSSFHRPDCRLVKGKEQLDFASADEAIARGLSPCRVCDPARAATR